MTRENTKAKSFHISRFFTESAIEAMEEACRTEASDQESCEDAISRRAVLDTLNKMDSALDEDRTVETYKELLAACYNDLPPVTPAHKTGKWIYSGSYDEDGMLLCSNCKHEIDVSEGYFKFCPNCGARMGDEE